MKYHSGVLLSEKCTDDMTETEWLQARMHGPSGDRDYTIGGSDVAAALGLSPYKSKIEFWEEKKGVPTPVRKKQPEETFKKGHRFEPAIAMGLQDDLEEIYGEGNVIIDFDKYIYGCADKLPNGKWKYPYMVVNYDCNIKIFFDGSWHFYLGEIKTLNENDYETQRNYKRGIVPIHYDCQCRYYMKVLDVDGIILCCAWGLSNECRAHQIIERDPVIENEMLNELDEFYWSLKTDIPPALVDDHNKDKLIDYWARKYPIWKRDIKNQIVIPESYREDVEEILKLDNLLIENKEKKLYLEQRRKEVLSKLFNLFIDNQKGTLQLDETHNVYIERKDSYERDGFDEEAFKTDYPQLYKEFSEEKLDVSKLRKAHASIAGEYLEIGQPTGKISFRTTLYDTVNQTKETTYQDAMQVWHRNVKGERKRA